VTVVKMVLKMTRRRVAVNNAGDETPSAGVVEQREGSPRMADATWAE
jgi:hypothetical protein